MPKTTKPVPADLLTRHYEYIAKAAARGSKIVAFNCPCCTKQIETRAAPTREVWDTMSQCPHCGGLFFKITRGAKVETLIPEGMNA